MIFPSDEMIEFRKHSSGTGKYAKVDSVACISGLRESGYSYAPNGRVLFKEVNLDGSVDMPVCSDTAQ